MTAKQDKDPSGGQGKGGDVQARQADDGSFELVVENTAASASSDSADGGTQARPGADSARGRSRSFNRLSLVIGGVLVVVGVGVYALSGDDADSGSTAGPSEETETTGSFRPYQGGPSNQAAGAVAAPVRQAKHNDEQFEEEPPASDEAEALEVAEGEEGLDEEWEPEEEGEVVVLEEEHPEEVEAGGLQQEEVDQNQDGAADANPRRLNPKVDTSKFRIPSERIKLPVQRPKLNRIPTPTLQKLQPSGGSRAGDQGSE